MRNILLIATVALSALNLSAQTTQKFTANKASEYGITYTLPQTAINVTLAAEKTVKTPGEFALYSKKYLSIDPILEKSVKWDLVQAELLPVAVADDEERYLVQFKAGTSPFMMLTPEGFPLVINLDNVQQPKTVTTSLKSIPAQPTILETPAANQAVTEDMLKSHSTAKRAELAAARIYEIRQQRSDIISGQADGMPSDGAAMQLALDNLQKQEDALTAMFIGTTSKSVEVKTFTVEPPIEEGNDSFIVARLSVLDGIVNADDLSGAPIYVNFSNIKEATLPVNEKGIEKTFPKGGVAYRIPGTADITVTYKNKTLAQCAMQVTQYGVVFGVDPALFTDKKAPSYLIFDTLTGGIIELGTKQPAN